VKLPHFDWRGAMSKKPSAADDTLSLSTPHGSTLPLPTADQAALALTRWNALESHIGKWYHDFDYEAFRASLAALACHNFLSESPVWMFIIGPSGTGKTVTISALSSLDNTHIMGDLTAQTFLSAYNKGRGYSMLSTLGGNFTLLFKDFTTFLSKRPDERGAIASQMREIYDGEFYRDTGASKKLEWCGKATVVCATTPAVEKAWTLLRDLGERFVTVRWPRGDGVAQAEKAWEQISNEKEINATLKDLTRKFFDKPTLRGSRIPDVLGKYREIIYLAEMVSRLRASVQRSSDGKREINDIPVAEGPPRLMKAMTQLVRGHATLFRRADPEEADMRIARRIAIDSIPQTRRAVFETIPHDGKDIGVVDIMRVTGLPRTTIDWTLEEMQALGVLEYGTTGHEPYAVFTDTFLELKKKALPNGMEGISKMSHGRGWEVLKK
jgi:hypothetical protein